MKRFLSKLLIFASFIAIFGKSFAASSPALDPAGLEFFEKQIRPVLVENCYKCHSAESGKSKGGLQLDTRENLLKGGDSGPAIVPNQPEKSLLIKAVRYTDKDLQMPPKGKKLSAEQVAALEQWIKIGAPDPRGSTTVSNTTSIAEQAKLHWAFQPVKNPALPAVKNKRWIKAPIDQFILAKLEAKNLKPSAPADKRTLIRRATFDLTGLPPTLEEVTAFEKDHSADAFAKVVDRLLASPRYGERWGRHWLDVARYADTKGYLAGNEERRFPYSYTYRDWVIRAFNEDLPYDQFLIQQIAADKLDLKDDKRPLAALGFLTLGRRFLNNQHDIIDDRIDVVTRGTMALTVACARCHDHKYDPVPTKDYYSLYGVFASSHEPEEKPLLGITPPEKPYNEYLAEQKNRENELNEYREKRIAETMSALRNKTGDYLLTAAQTEHLTDKSQAENLARERKLDPQTVARWRTSLSTWAKETNSIFAPWFAFAEIPEAEFSEKSKALSQKFVGENSLNPHVAKLFSGEPPKNLKEVAERYGKLFADVENNWREILSLHEKSNVHTSAPTALPDSAREQLRQILYADGMPFDFSKDDINRLFDVPTIEKVRELRRKVSELDATHPGAPPRAMALQDKETPSKPYVFIRGNAGNRGPEVPRQFLEILSPPDRKPFTNGSGRLELALAIANTKNPLTARVFVNRVWAHHFGKPLVNTPSDFGLRSDAPSHPELLDWLAYNFMANGWSVKKLHRQILLSAAYQQSSAENSQSAKIDPVNSLLWRMNRQRLEFEAMRDSLLAVSGKLNSEAGGLPVDIVNEPFSGRRSVYGYIDRQNLPGVFRTFDFANPDTTSAQRFFTTVPQQALFLLNSPFVVEQARLLLTNANFQKILRDKDKVKFLYERVFQREPDRTELRLAENFIRQQIAIAPLPKKVSDWKYGYGEFNAKSNRIVSFTGFPHFTGQQWQKSATFPDPQLAYATLDREGGHPGNHVQHAAIRRWTAPFDGVVKIEGELFHPADKGDGVLVRIVSSRDGQLGNWTAFNGKAQTTVAKCEVQRGDTLDFITEPREGPAYDSFKWAPTISVVEVKYGTPPPGRTTWNVTRDFAGPSKDTRPSTAWERYAQALLLSNEFMFVD